MPQLKIPCADCSAKTEEIELTGRYVVTSCEAIPGQTGWCMIKWTDAPARRAATDPGNAGGGNF